MLHKRSNCVSGNWQLPKNGVGGESADRGVRARARPRESEKSARIRRGCASNFEWTVVHLEWYIHASCRDISRGCAHRGSDRIASASRRSCDPLTVALRERERERYFLKARACLQFHARACWVVRSFGCPLVHLLCFERAATKRQFRSSPKDPIRKFDLLFSVHFHQRRLILILFQLAFRFFLECEKMKSN